MSAPVDEETAPDGAVGQRVALQRKLAGLTQYQLADCAHVSKSLVSQVERGSVPASPAFTAAIARALASISFHLNAYELTNQSQIELFPAHDDPHEPR